MEHNAPEAPRRRAARADARQNRTRILAAARARFAADGLEASMDDIARDAEVAVGTIYHHFGPKEALLEAVIRDNFQQVIAYLRTLASEPDPWAAVVRMVEYYAAIQSSNRAFKALMGASPTLQASTAPIRQELAALVQQVIERAQASGCVRAGVVASDLPLLLSGLPESGSEPTACARYIAIILDGLRDRLA